MFLKPKRYTTCQRKLNRGCNVLDNCMATTENGNMKNILHTLSDDFAFLYYTILLPK